MKITTDQFREWLTEKNVDSKCQVCGNSHVTIGTVDSGDLMEVVMFMSNNITVGIRHYFTSCPRCYHLNYFIAKYIEEEINATIGAQ
ncbi:MAG: hypothetical protein EKK54_08035 [Neisseriaceae bacterium]|nr:MAG: hypothetical protein EKK54_08035 [Neisseriaceae bacterium]